jgi:uncharacterized protein
MPKREIRVIRGAHIRAGADGKSISGYAAVFNSLSEDLGWFREIIRPGAFSASLATNPDVKCLFNHDPNLILGRTKSGTLRLSEDNVGLHFECDLPGTQAGKDTRESIDRGDIDQCSFAFSVTEQTWTDTKGENGQLDIHTRELVAVDLYDVSPVTYPAYTQTSVASRSAFHWPDGEPEDVIEHRGKEALDDEPDDNLNDEEDKCLCRACFDGECEECSLHMSRCDARFCRCHGAGARQAPPAQRPSEKHTKCVDGDDLSSSAFAYVGDAEKTARWKLPIEFSTEEKTKSHIRNAIARFGQTHGIPSDKKAGVWKKIAAAAKKYGIRVASEEDSLLDDFTETARRRVLLARDDPGFKT